MTRSTILGKGTLYVDGQPFGAIRDLRITREAEADPFAGVFDRGEVTVSFKDTDFAAFRDALSVTEQLHRQMVGAMRAAVEAEVRHMLGQWVSELEPELICGPGGEILGLGVAGAIWGEVRPVIRARPIVFGESDCRRCGSRYFSAGVNIDPTRCPRCGR